MPMPFSFWVIGPFDTSGNYWKISDPAETFMRSVCSTEPRTLNVIKRELNALKASIRHTVIKLLQI